MKKMIIAFTVLFSFVGMTAFATGEEKISKQALLTFKKQFTRAEKVSWRTVETIQAADFMLNGSRMEAYFDQNGEYLGAARNVLFHQLPLAVMTSLNKYYADASVYDMVECSRDGETFYTMTVELPGKKLQIRAGLAGNLSIEKKLKK